MITFVIIGLVIFSYLLTLQQHVDYLTAENFSVVDNIELLKF